VADLAGAKQDSWGGGRATPCHPRPRVCMGETLLFNLTGHLSIVTHRLVGPLFNAAFIVIINIEFWYSDLIQAYKIHYIF
jgi:hypothetical protein